MNGPHVNDQILVTDRPTLTPRGALYFPMFILLGISLSLLGPALPHLREQLGVSKSTIGLLFFSQSVGYVLGSLVGGRWFDRGLGHRLCQLGVTVAAGGMVGVLVAPDMLTQLGAFALIGSGCGVVDVGGNTLLSWSQPRSLERSMNLLHLSFGIGAALVPLFVSWSLRWLHNLRLAIGVIVFISVAMVVALQQKGPAVRAHTDAEGATRATPWRSLFIVATFFFVYVGVEAALAGWVSTYVDDQKWSSSGTGPVMASVFFAAFALGRLAAAAIGSRIQPSTTIIGSTIICVLTSALFVVNDGRQLGVWTSVVVLGLATGPQFPLVMTYADQRLQLTGLATSVFVGASGLGGMVFPPVMGALIDRRGDIAFPAFLTVGCLGILITFVVIMRSLPNRPAGLAPAAAAVGAAAVH
jgi:fucose permease